jgi:hypothetical protein
VDHYPIQSGELNVLRQQPYQPSLSLRPALFPISIAGAVLIVVSDRAPSTGYAHQVHTMLMPRPQPPPLRCGL